MYIIYTVDLLNIISPKFYLIGEAICLTLNPILLYDQEKKDTFNKRTALLI